MLKAKVSDAELEKMIADIANGVMYSISWPNKTQLALSLQKCRTKSAAEVLRLKDRIAELKDRQEILDAFMLDYENGQMSSFNILSRMAKRIADIRAKESK